MAKKKKESKVSPEVIKVGLVCILSLGVGLFLFNRIFYMFSHSDYFNITQVVSGPSLPFITQNDLERLKGKNIFSINIKKVQDKLELKYPQASELRVMRRFPNRIIIVAKERTPFVQIKVKDKYYVLDDKAVVLAVSSQYDKALPVIENFKLNKSQVNLGGIVQGRNIRVAIRIRTAFKEYMDSKKLSITRIDLKDISKINLYLSTELRIILDGDKLDKKIQVLNLVLTQKELNLKDVKYIDLRFKEPILGRK